jgi:hypothetical protein
MRVRTSNDDLGVQGLVGRFAGLPSCGEIPPRGRKSCVEVSCAQEIPRAIGQVTMLNPMGRACGQLHALGTVESLIPGML